MKIYKYIGLPRFFDILKSNELVLVKPESWDDPYENILIRFFNDEDKYNILYNKCKIYCGKNPWRSSVNEILIKIWFIAESTYCCCFTSNNSKQGTDEMWRSYSNNTFSVRFTYEIPSASYANLFPINSTDIDSEIIGLDKIIYKTINIEALIDNMINSKSLRAFFYKRPIFKYEKEIRLVKPTPLNMLERIIDSEDFNTNDFSTRENFLEFISKHPSLSFPKTSKIPFYPANVTDVLIHPLASESTVFFTEKLCDNFNLPNPKKSAIYTVW